MYNIDEIQNKLFIGDCLEIMKQIPDRTIDMILCDLPYGITRNKWDSVIPLDELWQCYNRIIKDNGTIVLTSQGLFTADLMVSNRKYFKYKMIWKKSRVTNFLNARKQPLRNYEDICVFYKKQPTYNPQMQDGVPYDKGIRSDRMSDNYGKFTPCRVFSEDGKRFPTDVIYFKTAECEGKIIHPTQKPVELGRYLIRTYTNEGDVVLDNCFGSGSFIISAILENRKFIGIEKNEKYFNEGKERINKYYNLI